MKPVWKKRIARPLGIYICTLVVFLNFGVLNFIGYYWELSHSNGQVPFSFAVISFGLCLFTAASAVWAYTGENEGRLVLLILLPLNVLWIVLLAVSALLDAESSNDAAAVVVLIRQTTVSFFVIAIEWYFLTGKVVEYYKQNDGN